MTMEFSSVSPGLFTGFVRMDDFYMASPEKALLDTLYLRKSLPAADELDMEHIDSVMLHQLAKGFPASVRRKLSEMMTGM